jgi:hypothetical protein
LCIPIHQLKYRAIENYFSLRALREVFGTQIRDDITELDPKKPLEKQIGFNVKRNNLKLAKQMTFDELNGTDLKEFFDKVSDMLQH